LPGGEHGLAGGAGDAGSCRFLARAGHSKDGCASRGSLPIVILHSTLQSPVTFREFERRAHEMFDSIPEDFREGVDGLQVERGAVPHPALPEIFTLGECRTEQYPSDFGGAGEVRSFVVLHYGSFVELAARAEGEWDWEGELWETITHEIRHHLESLAAEDALEVEDYVVDQNFARLEGTPFDPFFFKDGVVLDDHVFEVDGDVFVETEVGPKEIERGSVSIAWGGRSVDVPIPGEMAEVHYLTVEGFPDDESETVLVLVRRKGMWDSLRSAFSGGAPEVSSSRHVVRDG
jgi:hypothetical protein